MCTARAYALQGSRECSCKQSPVTWHQRRARRAGTQRMPDAWLRTLRKGPSRALPGGTHLGAWQQTLRFVGRGRVSPGLPHTPLPRARRRRAAPMRAARTATARIQALCLPWSALRRPSCRRAAPSSSRCGRPAPGARRRGLARPRLAGGRWSRAPALCAVCAALHSSRAKSPDGRASSMTVLDTHSDTHGGRLAARASVSQRRAERRPRPLWRASADARGRGRRRWPPRRGCATSRSSSRARQRPRARPWA